MRDAHGAVALWNIESEVLTEITWLLQVQLWANADPKKRGPIPKRPPTPWTAQQRSTQIATIRERLTDLEQRDRKRREAE